jgi:hypothetical protein
MVIVRTRVSALFPDESVAVTLMLKVPGDDGVPARTPVVVFSVTPAGRPVADQVNGPLDVPSAAEMVAE